MILFTNLEDIQVDDVSFSYESIVKLTSSNDFNITHLTDSKWKLYDKLLHEPDINNFKVINSC